MNLLNDYSYDDIGKLQQLYNYITNRYFEYKPENINLNKVKNITNDSMKKISQIQKITKLYFINPLELLYKDLYEKEKKIALDVDKCSICQCGFYDIEEIKDLDKIKSFDDYINTEIDTIVLQSCKDHFFHIDCILNLIGGKDSFKCPNCSKIYGKLIGNMPKGQMTYSINNHLHCAGYNNVGTIVIGYNMPSGRGYSGTRRTAYLPNNKEGQEVFVLLKVAFDRKHTFQVGTSVTTGQTNTVVWNGIHHKTNTSGGPTYFGYPDNTYFNRVKEELAAKGVTEESVMEENFGTDLETIAYNYLYSVNSFY